MKYFCLRTCSHCLNSYITMFVYTKVIFHLDLQKNSGNKTEGNISDFKEPMATRGCQV
jgi:hypothetical protein